VVKAKNHTAQNVVKRLVADATPETTWAGSRSFLP
jgi:hypothetical protein